MVRKVDGVPVDGSTPKKDVIITESGVIEVDVPFNVEKESTQD